MYEVKKKNQTNITHTGKKKNWHTVKFMNKQGQIQHFWKGGDKELVKFFYAEKAKHKYTAFLWQKGGGVSPLPPPPMDPPLINIVSSEDYSVIQTI